MKLHAQKKMSTIFSDHRYKSFSRIQFTAIELPDRPLNYITWTEPVVSNRCIFTAYAIVLRIVTNADSVYLSLSSCSNVLILKRFFFFPQDSKYLVHPSWKWIRLTSIPEFHDDNHFFHTRLKIEIFCGSSFCVYETNRRIYYWKTRLVVIGFLRQNILTKNKKFYGQFHLTEKYILNHSAAYQYLSHCLMWILDIVCCWKF